MKQNDQRKVQRENKKVLGITGGVGAGKSLVLDYLRKKYSARVIQADEVGHEVQEPGRKCYRQMIEVFGTDILLPDGRIDRSSLASIVFGNEQLLEKLNRLVHPAVKEQILFEIEEEQETGGAPFIVVEAALLLEAHYDEFCDAVWYIYADEETRRARLMETRGYSSEKVRRMMDSQMRENEFRSRCRIVIENNGNYELLYGQVDCGISALLAQKRN